MSKKLSALIAAAAVAGSTFLLPAEAAGVKVGVLSCNVDGGWGLILGSSKEVNCTFSTSATQERYHGRITKVGVDIGFTKGGVMIWDVLAPTSSLKPTALEGDYGGVTASATVAVGGGANVLIGGFDRSFTLQPISIEGNTGLNVAAGIGAMSLKYVKPS